MAPSALPAPLQPHVALLRSRTVVPDLRRHRGWSAHPWTMETGRGGAGHPHPARDRLSGHRGLPARDLRGLDARAGRGLRAATAGAAVRGPDDFPDAGARSAGGGRPHGGWTVASRLGLPGMAARRLRRAGPAGHHARGHPGRRPADAWSPDRLRQLLRQRSRPSPPMSHDQALVDSRIQRYAYFDEINRTYVEWQLDVLRPYIGRRVLEVGCGVGSVLALLSDRELLVGVDKDPEMVGHAAERFHGRDAYRFVAMDMAEPSPETMRHLAAQSFDTVVSINVLEHIPDDLAALRAMASLTGKQGHIALLVPAHPALYGPYDAVDGHVRRYTRSGLVRLIESANLEVVMVRRFNAVGAVGWWWQYKVLKRSIHGSAQFGLMTGLVPVCRWA